MAAVAMMTSACGARHTRAAFVEPTIEQPHAAVTVRVNYANRPDTNISDVLEIDGEALDVPPGNRRASGATLSVRAPLGAHRWQIGTEFHHYEMRQVTESVPVTKSVTNWCASRDSHGHCRSGSELRTSYELRTVLRRVKVPTASCDQARSFQLDAGGSYVVAFTFHENARCELTCSEQVVSAEGTPEAVPCKRPPPRAAVARDAAPGPHSKKSARESFGRTSVTLGVLGLVGAAGAGGYALFLKKDVQGSCDENRVCDRSGVEAAERGKKAVTVATISGVAGAAFLSTGLILLNGGSKEKGPTASAVLSPIGKGGQLAIRGGF